MRFVLACALLICLMFAVARCATERSVPASKSASIPMAVPSPTPSPNNKTAGADVDTVLKEALKRFNEVESYQFAIAATLRTRSDGKPTEWRYSGSGAFARPNSIRWSLEGQADVFFNVVSVGTRAYCADTRGEVKDCSLAFGGPRPGASPFTMISYMQRSQRQGQVGFESIGGKEYVRISFSPSMPAVASIDPAHARALANVASVEGTVLIDRSTGLPYRENVLVKYVQQGTGEDIVEAAITFDRYNQPVSIQPPRQP